MKKKSPDKCAGLSPGLSRREAAKLVAGGLGLFPLLFGRKLSAQPYPIGPGQFGEVPMRPTFFFAQVKYGTDLSWNPYPTAVRNLMELIVRRTSLQASPDRVDLALTDPKLYYYPFLYWTGTRDFPPLTDPELERLRVFLEFGGFLLVDDALSASGVGFDKAFQREFSRLFPGKSLTKLPEDHSIFRSYYLIDKVAGRTANRPYLSGLDQDGRTMLVYSGNDLGGAWARDKSGRWQNQAEPGGENQRELALRLGINIIMYSLCLDYKKDLVHVPFIEKRRKEKK